MRIAYLDCSTGISGDMTLGALIDAGVDVETIRRGIDSLDLPDVRLGIETVIKNGFRATYVKIEHPEQHVHRHLSDILRLVEGAKRIAPQQKELAKRVFSAVAQAEARVHGSSIEHIHFHEVGAIDSIVDIVGSAIGFDLLGADQIVSSPVPPGRGEVTIAHGTCPLPAPGTAELLKGIPLADVPIEAELTTPTGAAILRTVVDRFSRLPAMRIERIGYGAGTREFPGRANLLRLFVGTQDATAESDQVVVLETNLDDISAEIVGYTKQKLLEKGALDVFSIPIQMKKDRPGITVSVICRPSDAESLQSILFDETNTFGVRRHLVERSKRARREHSVETCWGTVRGKLGWRGTERPVFVPEFEACAQIANREGITLREVYRAAESRFEQIDGPEVSQQSVSDHDAPQTTSQEQNHGHEHKH